MNLLAAREAADVVLWHLTPYCDRIEIAGSVRRRKPDVGDIEVVAIPKTVEDRDLFWNGDRVRSPMFAREVRILGEIRKGVPEVGRYIQIWLDPEKIQLDLFLATPDNWGLILAIRTGSARYSRPPSQWMLAAAGSSSGASFATGPTMTMVQSGLRAATSASSAMSRRSSITPK